MTKREAAIISAHTGVLIGDFGDTHAYIENLLGHAVQIHDFLDDEFQARVKRKSKKDFLEIASHLETDEAIESPQSF